MSPKILLINFRIPLDLKSQFEESCSVLRTNMTAEMNRMVREFFKTARKDQREASALHGGQDDI